MKRLAVSGLGLLAFLTACGPAMKPPTLQVQALKKGSLGITGAKLDVVFGVRNPNPEDLAIDKMEFELIVNDHGVGHGYVSEPFTLRGFAEERVVSTVNVNYLKLPGAVKDLLQDNEVKARAKGTFYVQKGSSLQKLPFDSEAKVGLGREN